MTTRPGLILPDPETCPQVIAEAVWDVRNRQGGPLTQRLIQDRYATEKFFMMAVEQVFYANEWSFTAEDKRNFRSVYRGK